MARSGFAAVLLAGLLLVAACGMNAQTLKPYTPAEGVNFDVGDPGNPTTVVHVRNLLLISRAPGSGIVSASIVTGGSDSLAGVSGVPYKVDGSKGGPLQAQLGARVQLGNSRLAVLTDQTPLITVTSADLTPGLDAELTLQFAKAGSYTTRVPVVDGTLPPYASISPSPRAASASPSA